MTQEEALQFAIKLMRERNYCEIATNRMLAKIKEKETWVKEELESLLLGKK